MNERSKKRYVVLGIFTLIGLLFLAGGILVIGNLHETFSKKVLISVNFQDISGLTTGSNIWYEGVKIGTVKDIEFTHKSRVRVIMRIKQDAQPFIYKDAKARIGTDGLIGNKIIIITGGNESAGQIGNGDSLGVNQMLSAEDVLNTLQESNKNILAITEDIKGVMEKLNGGEGSLGKILKDESLYNNLNSASSSLRAASEKAVGLLNSVSSFATKLNTKGNLVNDLVTDTVIFVSIKNSVTQLQQISDTAKLLIDQVKMAGNNPNSAIGVLLKDKDVGRSLKATLKNLENGSQKLDKDLEAVQHSFLFRRYFKNEAKRKIKSL